MLKLYKSIIYFLAQGFGSGRVPFAPGTFGTLAAIPIYLALHSLPLSAYLGLVLLLFLAGIYLCQETAKALGEHDHPSIVWDEIVGYLLTMLALPYTWYNIILGFAFFRLFDILKPWPINWLDQKLEGGLGIMLDDILAAVYAWLCLQALIIFL